MHAKNTLHHSLLPWDITFWRILQFDWPTTFWLITREPEFCQICDWWWNINNNNNFPFWLFPGKLMTKFSRNKKTLLWGHFGQSLPKFGEKWIFLEKRTLPVFKYSNYLPWCKTSEKTNHPLLMDRRRDSQPARQTENSEFIGLGVGQRSKISNLEQSATLFEREK